MLTPLARFDGSVMVERTTGEVSACCHDEQANMLALNLMDEMVNGTKGLGEARDYYAQEFLDARRKQLTPYMEKLRFAPLAGSTADPDERALGRGARSGRPRWERGGGLILGAGPASRVYRHCGGLP